MSTVRFIAGDAIETLRSMPADSVHCVVTSPPYWGLREYLPDNHPSKPLEIGLEPTLGAYVARLVDVFAAARRTLRRDRAIRGTATPVDQAAAALPATPLERLIAS